MIIFFINPVTHVRLTKSFPFGVYDFADAWGMKFIFFGFQWRKFK